MSLPLDQLMADVAAYLKTDLQVEREVYVLVIPLSDGRTQEVCATIRRDREQREIVDVVSTVGPAQGADPWLLLQTNGQTLFSRVTVAHDMIFVVASQLLATAQPEEVLLMMHEVAHVADDLERGLSAADEF
jgi:23S rRNA pseudoU1915 N3-methylase RlmH